MIKILDNRISSRVDADQDPKSHILGPPGDDTVQGPQRENDIVLEIVMTPLRRKTGKCLSAGDFCLKKSCFTAILARLSIDKKVGSREESEVASFFLFSHIYG